MDEIALVIAARQGNLEAFSQLVLRYQAGVRACLAVRTDNPHDAEDLAQEVFVVAFEKLDQFDTTRAMGPWLRGIAINLLRNHIRKPRMQQIAAIEELQDLVDTEMELMHSDSSEAERCDALRECIERLDVQSRRIVMARYEEDMDVAELCRRFGKKHSAVTMQLHRIREQLRSCMDLRLRTT